MQFSGNYRIDSILSSNPGLWERGSNTVTYSFTLPGSGFGSEMTTFTEAQIANVRAAVAYVEGVTGIDFVESTSTGATLLFGAQNLSGNIRGTWTYWSGQHTVALDTYDYGQSLSKGSVLYQVLLHEMGHALGLDHSFDGPYSLPSNENNTSNTLMSYTQSGGYKSTYSPYDLWALSWIYGGDGIRGTYGLNSTNGPTIPDAAYPPVTHALSGGGAARSEDAGSFTFTITRTGNTSAATTVTWQAGGGVDAADFGGTLATGSVSFASGETTKTATVSVVNDNTVEANEQLTITLTEASGPGAQINGAADEVQFTVNDDDAPPTVRVAGLSSASEGNTGTQSLTLTLVREGLVNKASTVAWTVLAGTASATDFAGGQFPAGQIVFAPGEQTKTITFGIAGDTLVEPDETFTVRLQSVDHAVIAAGSGGQAAGTIPNDDFNSTIRVTAPTAALAEGNDGQTLVGFTFTRSGDVSQPASASYRVDDTGHQLVAGTATSGQVSFAAGERTVTLNLPVAADGRFEADSTLQVSIAAVDGLGVTFDPAAAEVLVRNDDSKALVSVTADVPVQLEAHSGTVKHTFTVTREGDLSTAASMPWAVTGTANGTDFGNKLPTGTVSFAAGQGTAVITVHTRGDTTVEPDETFTLALMEGAELAPHATQGSATVTLVNDDLPPQIAIRASRETMVEGTSTNGRTMGEFIVTRTGDLSKTASVDWAVALITDGANVADFGGTVPQGKVSFAAGVSQVKIQVPIVQDSVMEADESFQVRLSNAQGAPLSTTNATAGMVITNDDLSAPVLSLRSAEILSRERDGAVVEFELVRTGLSSSATSVGWRVELGTADHGDFLAGQAMEGRVSFLPGQTVQKVTLKLTNDSLPELHDTFALVLHTPQDAMLGPIARTEVVIRNDDRPAEGPAHGPGAGQAAGLGLSRDFLFDAAYFAGVTGISVDDAYVQFQQQPASSWQSPTPLFDPDYYASRWDDLRGAGFDDATLFAHFNLYGVWEGRSPGGQFDAFDGARYLQENPDVAAYVNANLPDFLGSATNGAIAHFLIYGIHEERSVFDVTGNPIDLGYML